MNTQRALWLAQEGEFEAALDEAAQFLEGLPSGPGYKFAAQFPSELALEHAKRWGPSDGQGGQQEQGRCHR